MEIICCLLHAQRRRGPKKGEPVVLEADPTTQSYCCFGAQTCMNNVIIKWARQGILWVNMGSTLSPSKYYVPSLHFLSGPVVLYYIVVCPGHAKKWLRPILSHRSTLLLGVSNHSVSISGKILLAFASTVTLGSGPHGNHYHIFLLPTLESCSSLCSNHSVLCTSPFCIRML